MSGKRHFVVERLNWRLCEESGPFTRAKPKVISWARLPGAERVAGFDDIGAADADCRRREEALRRQVNPFACGSALCYLSSLDEGRLRDWMLDAGLTPPEAEGLDAWPAWWERAAPAMTDLQRAKAWEALDRLQFFRVVESSRRVLFVVAGAYWRYNDEYYYRQSDGLDEYYYRQSDGLTPYKAFRSREAAEAEQAEMEAYSRYEMDWGGGSGLNPFQINGLDHWEAWSSLPQAEAVERVEALGLPPPGPGQWGDTLDWENWWDQADMTPSQRDAVWDLLDRNRFWEVIEVEVPD
jgi:hypothetical protein